MVLLEKGTDREGPTGEPEVSGSILVVISGSEVLEVDEDWLELSTVIVEDTAVDEVVVVVV